MTQSGSADETPAATHVLAAVEGTDFIVGKLAPAFGGLAMHSRSRQVADAPDTITGSAPQWGYLASVIRTERESATGLEAVQLRLRVREGTVGVGLLDAQGAAFVDSVDGIEGDAVTAVTFFVRGMQQTGRLVIRNAGTGPATFEWLGVDSLLLKDRPDLLRECLRPHDLTTVSGWSRYYGNFALTPAEAIRQLLFDELREPLVMPWVRDLRVTITPGEETSRALFVSGTYEPASMIAVQRLLAPGGVLFDVGANVGLYTLLGSRCVGAAGHVYSFEPSSRERTTLDANLGLNGCRNVTTSAAAVGARTGSARLRIAAGQHRGQNTLSPAFAYPGVGLEREEEVEMVSLDQFTQIPGVRQPNVIKIDAEGNDLDVLRGARSVLRDAMPVVMFEINDTLLQASGASRIDVETLLHDVGYELFRISEDDAALVRVSSLQHEQSENFVAIPAG